MPKTKVDDWSTTAASNTDVGGISIAGTAPLSNVDDALREIMKQIAATPLAESAADMMATLGAAGGTITGELLIGTAGGFGFEGATDNAYETRLTVTDPTADRTITFPDQTGTVALTTDGYWLSATADDAIESGVGYTATSADDGTKSSGSYTPTPAGGNFKRIVNGGAFTLNAPTAAGDYTLIIQITNNATAGAITLSGFSKSTGDTFTTTNGDDFLLYVAKINGFTHSMMQRLQ